MFNANIMIVNFVLIISFLFSGHSNWNCHMAGGQKWSEAAFNGEYEAKLILS